MKAPALVLAIFLAHGCAPAQLVSGSVRGDPEAVNVCMANDHCGLGGGGTGTVALPMAIMLAAFATPAVIYLLL